MSLPRLNKEYRDMINNNPLGITIGMKDKSIYEWIATLVGPSGTPYENGLFKLSINFTKNYPFEAPKIKFTTPIYHCNINSNGEICLDILKDNWSPALTIDKVLLSISSLLNEANPYDPLVPTIAQLYRSDKSKHDLLARKHTIEYAM